MRTLSPNGNTREENYDDYLNLPAFSSILFGSDPFLSRIDNLIFQKIGKFLINFVILVQCFICFPFCLFTPLFLATVKSKYTGTFVEKTLG